MPDGVEQRSEKLATAGASESLAMHDAATAQNDRKASGDGAWRPGMGYREYLAVRKPSFTHWLVLKTVPYFVSVLPLRMRLFAYRLMGVKFRGTGHFIGRGCLIDPVFPEMITLEDHVSVAPRVIIECHQSRSDLLKPVTLGPRSFVCTGAIIAPGVSIGAGAIVGAGSVVFRSVPAGVIVIGSPARVVGKAHSEWDKG
jgi:acetyltransferase-like isoleucine patch superfamily enzyme